MVGGYRPGSGRKIGSRSRSTIEREKKAELELERVRRAERILAAQQAGQLEVLAAQPMEERKLMKDIGFDLAVKMDTEARFFESRGWRTKVVYVRKGKRRQRQEILVNNNPHYDEARWRYYSAQALAGADKFGTFESPKMSAVLVAAQVVNKVEVTGGMPDEFAAPVEGDPGLKPGDIVSAEEGIPDRKVVGGEIVQLPVAPKAAAG